MDEFGGPFPNGTQLAHTLDDLLERVTGRIRRRARRRRRAELAAGGLLVCVVLGVLSAPLVRGHPSVPLACFRSADAARPAAVGVLEPGHADATGARAACERLVPSVDFQSGSGRLPARSWKPSTTGGPSGTTLAAPPDTVCVTESGSIAVLARADSDSVTACGTRSWTTLGSRR